MTHTFRYGAHRTAETAMDIRVGASSVGMLAVRVAIAAARKREGSPLNENDRRAVSAVIRDLETEAKVLRGESEPDISDETSYAFAGFALTAIADKNDEEGTVSDKVAVQRLTEVVGQLHHLLDDPKSKPALLEEIERVFLSASRMASGDLGRTGERLEGAIYGAL